MWFPKISRKPKIFISLDVPRIWPLATHRSYVNIKNVNKSGGCLWLPLRYLSGYLNFTYDRFSKNAGRHVATVMSSPWLDYYGQPNDFDRGWTIESLWKPHTKNGWFGGWPPALWAKVIICYVYTYKYGTNRTSECYSIPTFYYTENFSLISKYFNSKCPVVNTPAAIFIPTKMATKTWHFEMKCFEINDIFSA